MSQAKRVVIFLFGLRSMSRSHLDAPYGLDSDGQYEEVRYTRAESRTHIFRGNSNWRGPHFREIALFYEYLDGDTCRGCGASHQTGWTARVAKLLRDLDR